MASSGEQTFDTRWSQLASPEWGDCWCEELHFRIDRDWRFDRANILRKVAVEIEGGVYSGGRHTRGSGFTGDCEKYNAAALDGWSVLRYTTGMLDNDPARCIQEIETMLRCRAVVAPDVQASIRLIDAIQRLAPGHSATHGDSLITRVTKDRFNVVIGGNVTPFRREKGVKIAEVRQRVVQALEAA